MICAYVCLCLCVCVLCMMHAICQCMACMHGSAMQCVVTWCNVMRCLCNLIRCMYVFLRVLFCFIIMQQAKSYNYVFVCFRWIASNFGYIGIDQFSKGRGQHRWLAHGLFVGKHVLGWLSSNFGSFSCRWPCELACQTHPRLQVDQHFWWTSIPFCWTVCYRPGVNHYASTFLLSLRVYTDFYRTNATADAARKMTRSKVECEHVQVHIRLQVCDSAQGVTSINPHSPLGGSPTTVVPLQPCLGSQVPKACGHCRGVGPDVSDGECLEIRNDPCYEFLLKLLVEAKDRVRCPHICKAWTASLFLLIPSPDWCTLWRNVWNCSTSWLWPCCYLSLRPPPSWNEPSSNDMMRWYWFAGEHLRLFTVGRWFLLALVVIWLG